MGSKIVRPVVRSFKERFSREAAEWVKIGGHAIVWRGETRALLVFPKPARGALQDLGFWAVLDLGKSRYDVPKEGPFAGLATTPFPRDHLDIAQRRAERDSIWEGPTRTIELDCLECGACCRDNEVILEKVDIERFRRAGRPELAKAPLAKRRNGKLMLTLLPDGRCRHLSKKTLMCAIYTERPDSCSSFPAGSECCLYARGEEIGVWDGVPPSN